MSKKNYQLVNISKISLDVSNPRLIKEEKFDKLKKSIKDFPEMLKIRPIIVDENYVVIGGAMRTQACIALGMKKVPVYIAKGLTKEKKEEMLIKDNVSFGDWDWESLYLDNTREDLRSYGIDVWISDDDETVGTGSTPSDPDAMPKPVDADDEYNVICPECAEEFKVKIPN